MKTLKITTHWTPEEADCIYQFLDDFKSVLWENYGEDMVQMHKANQDEQQLCREETFNDELPF